MKLAILSDIHEDVENLKYALKKLEKKNCDKIVCLGDISGFSAPHYNHYNTRNAHLCLKLIEEHCEIVVVGNHDLNVCKRIPENSPYFEYPKNWYNLDYYEKKQLSQNMVWLYDNDELNPLYKKSDIEYLINLPEYHILDVGKFNILFSHYLYPNLTGSAKTFISEIYDFQDHFKYMNTQDCQISICGHAHFPNSLVVYENEVRRKRSGKIQVRNENLCIVAPSVVNSNKRGRFLTFDTNNLELEIIKI